VQDCVAAYGAVLAEKISADRIAVGGDSAGGGLTLSMLLALRDANAPLPAAGVLLSPWTDLTMAGPSYTFNADLDPSISRAKLDEAAGQYAPEQDRRAPLLSTVNADLLGLPPLIVQVGGHETMLDDSTLLAERAQAAGVEVMLEVWPELWHVWHHQAPGLPEANDAIGKIAVFIERHVKVD
jgi:acetyl esterase/lipase